MFFEEPVLPEYPEATTEIRRVARIPIATGERLFTRYPFSDLFAMQAVDVVQPDICTVGGIYECQRYVFHTAHWIMWSSIFYRDQPHVLR